ncbi:RNA polymerase II transcription factor B subunit 5 [Terfezia claveryi]|nr:RNA polymerase II transcription factor B subunit 5 [Terfezia claveryi]
MPRAVKGVLVECDPSIKAIILKIDGDHNDFIIEDLDDNTLLVKETKIPELKRRLERMLEDTQTFPEDEDSE